MTVYREVLEKVVRQEYGSAIFCAVFLLICMATIWGGYYFGKKKACKKPAFRKRVEQALKLCRQSLAASIAASVCFSVVGVLGFLSAGQMASDINADIQAESYITYHGGYHIEDNHSFGQKGLYEKYWTVDFDNGEYAYVYMNNVVEAFTAEEGSFTGTVVYGENSRIVVDISHNE